MTEKLTRLIEDYGIACFDEGEAHKAGEDDKEVFLKGERAKLNLIVAIESYRNDLIREYFEGK